MELPKLSIPSLPKNTKKLLIILVSLVCLLGIIILLIRLSIQRNHFKKCRDLYQEVATYTDQYMDLNQIYPTINGQSYTVDLKNIDGAIYFDDTLVTGSVIYTKYDNQILKTYQLENCKYCEANWGNETDKYNENASNVLVTPYFNYYDVSYYNSKWSNWISFDDIQTEPTDGINLPINSNQLPKIPEEAITVEIIKEDALYYSYRDKKWKFYRNNIPYSDLSSEQPAGYANKDTATETQTEWTDWSMNYPEEKEYRSIQTKTAYRWYYEEKGEKIYWNNGAYWPEQPDEVYSKRSKETATMYSYRDKKWKWYNGTIKRQYSSYMSQSSSYYIYRDDDLVLYTDWTKYSPNSQLNTTNQFYREEQSKTYSRYLIQYKMLSLPIFQEAKTLQELQDSTGKTLEELTADNSIQLEVQFKFRY